MEDLKGIIKTMQVELEVPLHSASQARYPAAHELYACEGCTTDSGSI